MVYYLTHLCWISNPFPLILGRWESEKDVFDWIYFDFSYIIWPALVSIKSVPSYSWVLTNRKRAFLTEFPLIFTIQFDSECSMWNPFPLIHGCWMIEKRAFSTEISLNFPIQFDLDWSISNPFPITHGCWGIIEVPHWTFLQV